MQYQIVDRWLHIQMDVKSYPTLIHFLDAYHIGKKVRYQYLSNHYIRVNEQIVSHNYIFQKDDVLSIYMPKETIDYPAAKYPCKVVYEDDFVYIVHKPSDLLIHDDHELCLANLAACYQKQQNIEAPVRYLHRLDKQTSGLVMFCKIPFFQSYFDGAIEHKQIKRYYLAITKSNSSNLPKTIEKPIGKDRHQNNRYRISPSGKYAKTNISLVDYRSPYCLIECQLETGRTHQIRVHLSSIHHLIVNDDIYGTHDTHFQAMGLWAYRLEWISPITNQACTCTDEQNTDYLYFKR